MERMKKGRELGRKDEEKKSARWKEIRKKEGWVEGLKRGRGQGGKDTERKRARWKS